VPRLYRDVLERAAWTAAQVFLATWVVTDIQTLQTAAVAAVAAGISVIKSYLASKVGDPDSASVLKD
jgi:hypothetical protein